MTTYAEFSPTAFDRPGAFLDDRQDWIVAPCSQTRDSDALSVSNFEACLEMLGGESDQVEVHRFGHWGPGWFEIILAHPSLESKVAEIQERLEDYPVLDEEDWSNREFEDYLESFEQNTWEFCRMLQRELDLSDLALDKLQDAPTDKLREFHESLITSGEYYIEGYPNFRDSVRNCTRQDMADFIRSL